jgi:hypothetical protein
MANEKAMVRADSIGAAIVVKQENGEVVRITRNVKLSIEDGTLVKLPMNEKVDGQWLPIVIPSAKGYMTMAGDAGIVVHHPDTVVIDGREMPNGATDSMGRAYFRSVALGYSSTGQPCITDRTIVYDAATYMAQDLLAKACKAEFASLFEMGPLVRDTTGQLIGAPQAKDGQRWIGYPMDAQSVLWLDVSKKVVFEWYKEMKQREKTSIRTAQTFADRNAIAAHPGLPAKRKFHTSSAVVPVTTWYANKGIMRFDKSLVTVDPTKLLGVPAEDVVVDQADPQDITAAVEEFEAEKNADPLDPSEVAPEAENAEPESAGPAHAGSDVQVDELIANIKRLKGSKPPSIFKKACEKLGITIVKEAELAALPLAKLQDLLGILS